MASQVGICNRALQKLGASPITSLDDGTTVANALSAAYDPVRLALLRSYTWSFAIKRAELAASASAPAFGYNNAFPLPADWVKMAPPDTPSQALDFVIEGKSISSNDSAPLQIRYVSDVTDVNQMDVLFREALACDLAHELCELVTQSNTKKADLKNDKRDTILEARRTNAIEKPTKPAALDSWVTVRR